MPTAAIDLSWPFLVLGFIPFLLIVYGIRRMQVQPLTELAIYLVFWGIWVYAATTVG